MDSKDIQKQIDQVMQEENNRSRPDFEGYSPFEMHQILHFTFGENSPISFKKLANNEYDEIPMLSQIKYLLNLIGNAGELKLTAKGFLPTKVVKEIYDQEFIDDLLIDSGTYQIYKEADSMTVNLTRHLVELAGLVKKRNGKLSLTKNGTKLLGNNKSLFELIFNILATKFNWAYYDGYGDNHIGQIGYGFSIILLSMYGNERRRDNFYAQKYFNAFPDLNEIEARHQYSSAEEDAFKCYSLRTFDRFLKYFNLVKIEEEGDKWFPDIYITKTQFFDKLIDVQPHKIRSI